MNKFNGGNGAVVCNACGKIIRNGTSDNYFDLCDYCQEDCQVIDNFDLLSDLLVFDSPTTFYWVQVISRKKDNGGSQNKIRKEFLIYSIEQLYTLKSELIKLSTLYNARVVLWVNSRDTKELAIPLTKLTLSYIESQQFNNISRAFSRVCGQYKKHGVQHYFIVDVDCKNETYLNKVADIITQCGSVQFAQLVPTIHGFHIICTPFNVELFNVKVDEAGLEKIDVHKDNPTLLFYCPE